MNIMKTHPFNSIICAAFLTCIFSSMALSQGSSDGSIDFTSYKTYAFPSIQVNDTALLNYKDRLLMVQRAIESELTSRGYEITTLGSADLLMNIGITIVEEVQTRESDIREGAQYTGQRNYHKEAGEVVVSYYKRGTVTLDVVDVAKNKMIWQGVSDGVVKEDRTDKKAQKNVNRGMKNLFKKFPVKPIK